jgi:hypothetical protein
MRRGGSRRISQSCRSYCEGIDYGATMILFNIE